MYVDVWAYLKSKGSNSEDSHILLIWKIRETKSSYIYLS